MLKKAVAFSFAMAMAFSAVADEGCLDKSELVLSETTTFGPCVLKEPLELRTKQLYCENKLLDEWLYWAGKYEQKEKTVSKVLVQITNTCTNKVVHSKTETKVTENTGNYYISDNRSLYPDASSWYVHRYADRVDHIKATDCGSFPEGTKQSERGELLSEYEAKQVFAEERQSCESNR